MVDLGHFVVLGALVVFGALVVLGPLVDLALGAGVMVGEADGDTDGVKVGEADGDTEGVKVGEADGDTDGVLDDLGLGLLDDLGLGLLDDLGRQSFSVRKLLLNRFLRLTATEVPEMNKTTTAVMPMRMSLLRFLPKKDVA